MANLFDEKSKMWITILKNYTIMMYWIYIIAAVVMTIGGWCGWYWWIDGGFLDGIICLAGGVFMAYAQLVVNMLLIQFLNNVQIIREKIENKEPDADLPEL